MRKSLRTIPAGGGKSQGQFFQKQLAGEEGPSFETVKRLWQRATEFVAQQPWNLLGDEDLILLEDPRSGEICYCSIMGALGQVYSLYVYVGAEGYRFFRRLLADEPVTPGDFFATQRGVSVEFVMPSTLTPPDRELLQAVGHPGQRGIPAPIFRALRPGYHPWYVTHSEAELLICCLQATNTFCQRLSETTSVTYWDELDTYPFLVPIGNDENRRDYEVRLVKAPEPPVASPQVPEVDAGPMGQIREKFAPGGVFEVDHFFSGAMVGGKNERKACLHVGLVSDAASGMVFQPALGKPGESTGDILVAAILSAIKSARWRPKEVRVKKRDLQILLEPMGMDLGFSVRTVRSLPAVKPAKAGLLAMLGDKGPIPRLTSG